MAMRRKAKHAEAEEAERRRRERRMMPPTRRKHLHNRQKQRLNRKPKKRKSQKRRSHPRKRRTKWGFQTIARGIGRKFNPFFYFRRAECIFTTTTTIHLESKSLSPPPRWPPPGRKRHWQSRHDRRRNLFQYGHDGLSGDIHRSLVLRAGDRKHHRAHRQLRHDERRTGIGEAQDQRTGCKRFLGIIQPQ